VLLDPMVRVRGSPSSARVTVAKPEAPDSTCIIICAGNVYMIKEPIELRDAQSSPRLDSRRLERVYLAPNRKDLSFTIKDGYISTWIPITQLFNGCI